MTYNPLELTEMEEDYTGINIGNLVVEENHDFTNDPDKRIFSPDLGQFYVNEKFLIRDPRTNKVLVRGVDYRLEYLSDRIFKKSGLPNYYLINIINNNVVEVNVTYQAVGGLYTSPAYLIAMMMDKYPDGIGPVVYWKNVLYKPDQFVPAGHRHHSLEIYAMSPMVDALEQLRGSFGQIDKSKFADFFTNTTTAFNELMARISVNFETLQTQFETVRKGVELQQGDFVYTDAGGDQYQLRKYGKWKRHSGVILAAGGANNAGTTMSVGSGFTNAVRKTNLYQRLDDPWGNNPDIETQTLILQPSKSTFNEGETITINVQGVNIEPGTLVTGKYVGIPTDNIKDGNLTWSVTLNNTGAGSFQLVTVNNSRTTNDVTITVLPDYFSEAAIQLTMVDTSKTPVYNLFFSSDANGSNPITRANEGTVVYMNLQVTNPILNEVLTCNYSSGTATQSDFVTPLPETLTVPSNGIVRVRLEIKNDEVAEGEEVFVAMLLPQGSNSLSQAKARSELIINDTSYQAEFDSYFSADTGGVSRITTVDEGQTCYIFARTTLQNGTTVNFEYGGTATAADFDYRASSAVVSNGVLVGRIVVKADNITEGDEILGVTCKRTDGTTLSNMSIVIKDTSLSPTGTIFFASTNGGNTHTNSFNEGQTIFITISTQNLENGAYVELQYEMDGASNQDQINAEFTAPLPTRVPITNNRAVIAATILEDYTADGDRNFKAILVMNNSVASCVIRDSSVPVYTARFSGTSDGNGSISEINEGQTCYLVYETKGVPAGRVFNIIYGGSANDSDFTAARPTTLTMNSAGKVIIPYGVKEDYISEGLENMTVSIREGSTNRAQTSINIRDTSLTPVLGVLLSISSTNQTAITSINEGVTAYVHVNWTNVPLNTNIKWEVIHGTTSGADFDKTSSTFTNTEYTGTVADAITTIADNLSEGDETFKIRASFTLPDGRVITAETSNITLVDTSKTQVFSMYFSTDANGNTPINRINEGQTCYLIVKGENVPNGTVFRFGYGATGNGYANDADITPAFTNLTKAMANNFISHQFTVVADRTTEGDESLVIRATRSDNNVSRDASIVIVDTSKQMTATTQMKLSNNTTPANNTFKEGESGYVELAFTNATIGDIITCNLQSGNGNVDSSDFTASQFGQERVLTAENGSVYWTFTIANDRVTEGNENFAVNVQNKTTTIGYPLNGTYTVEDTSKTTEYTFSGFSTGSDNAIINTCNEGDVVLLQTIPVNGVIGDIYRMSITGGTATIGNDFTVNTNDLTYNTFGSKIAWTFNILNDRLTESNETIIAQIVNVTSNQTVGSFQLTILDTSKTPSATSAYYTAASGGSVITSANEGTTAFLRVTPINGVNGDQWRVSIDSTSQATAADIDNFTPQTITDSGQDRNSFVYPINITNDELTEGNENLIMLIELKRNGSSTWEKINTATLLIVDTSRTPIFETYFASDANGTNRVTQTNEGTTVYAIIKTTNVAAGTVLQIDFVGSTVDRDDFTSSFPADLSSRQDVTVGNDGIASFRFDVKEDFKDG